MTPLLICFAMMMGDTTGTTISLSEHAPDEYVVYFPNGTKTQSLISLEQMEAYLAECWNDSSQVWVANPESGIHWNDSTGIGWSDGLYRPPVKKWIHRTPTFEGFIKWMRGRK